MGILQQGTLMEGPVRWGRRAEGRGVFVNYKDVRRGRHERGGQSGEGNPGWPTAYPDIHVDSSSHHR